MEQAILVIHVLAALGIVALILIQQGKGADAGASFGAGASQTVFGSSGGGNVLTKTTAICATIFFATSFGLAVVAKNKADLSGDVDASLPSVVESVAPAAPENDIPADELSAPVDALDIPEVTSGSPDTGMGDSTVEEIPVSESSPQQDVESGIPE